MPIPAGSFVGGGKTVRFVESIAASPTVRLDVNTGSSFIVLRDGSSFNPPEMRRSIAETVLADGGYIGATALALRTIMLRIRLTSVSEDAVASLLRQLVVELNRSENILQVEWGTTPIFFRTFRSLDFEVDTSDIGLGRLTVDCPILAEPFAYGLRVDAATVNVKYNASLTNGLYLDVTGVTGDVDTPAYIKTDTGPGADGWNYLFVVRRRGTPSSAPYVVQAEALTASTDTATLNDGANATPASTTNSMQTTFATNTARVSRMTGTLASAADLRGTYRVFMRCRKTVSGDTITAAFNMRSANFDTDTVTLGGTTSYQMVDLGLIQIPAGVDSNTGYSGTSPNPSTISYGIKLGRTAGTGNCIVDEIFFVTADTELAIVTYDASQTMVLDGPNDAQYYLPSGTIGTSGVDTQVPARVGLIPQLTPGQTNRIYVLPTGGLTPAFQTITPTINVTVSHWPRYLVV